MTLSRAFFAYMVLIGAAAGAILIAIPAAADFVIKPYFWILLSVLAFDGFVIFKWKNAPGTMLPMVSRVVGFAIGIALMVALPSIAGTPVRYF